MVGDSPEQQRCSRLRERAQGRADALGAAPEKRMNDVEARGIERMVDDDRYCIDILTQISAVSTALDSLAFQILDSHVNHCVAGALSSGDKADAEAKTQELLEAVQRFAKMR